MRWLRQHDILLAREVVALDPYQHPKGGTERFALWEKIAANLDGFHLKNQINFSVTGRSVRDRVNLVLIRNYKKKMQEERKASGIEVPPPTEFDQLMEEIVGRAGDAEKEQKAGQDERKEKEDRERKVAEEVRAQALERVGQTRKRQGVEAKEDKPVKRRSGGETIEYLKERSQQQMKLREEELKIQREAQEANAKAQQAFTAQLLQEQQQQQQNMFAALQKEQQQQWQQQQQMQASIMLQQQQQQQSQAMMAILQELVKKKLTVSYQEKSVDTCIILYTLTRKILIFKIQIHMLCSI